MVLAASEEESPQSRAAFEQLCRIYWYPLYAFARRKGASPHDAEDLVQGFFARLVENHGFARADPCQGRFRSFLIGCFERHRIDGFRRENAIKRGSGTELLSIDEVAAESAFGASLQPDVAIEAMFDREWATVVLERAFNQLMEEWTSKGKGLLFHAIVPWLQHSSPPPYEGLANSLGRSVDSLKVEVHRMRARYREITRAQVRDTVKENADVDQELRYLIEILAR